ncbi:MAG: RNA 2',3'-cyclic phosphodiesterase [Candidatus Omnitrophica bacterium]|nr:RNA 2',3'-cyclic phosphodiesterase [Candidatus Omnitrophota bacterium]
MSESIRTFIALELSTEAKEELARIISELEKADAIVKWVDPKTVHLTLKFLGSIPEEKVLGISEKLKKIASSTRPFDIGLSGVGVFPTWDHIKVIWAGVSEGALESKALAEKIDKAMHEEGFDREKRAFSPHLTLGRMKSVRNKDELKNRAKSLQVNPVKSHITSIVFFRSDLTPEGAVHTPLYSAEL